jgi:transketolase
MAGMAAGLAFEGKIPWMTSIAPFVTMRCCEQIRTDICYNNLHVVIVSVMAGISGAPLGATHYATEDIGIFRSMANMTILNPADQWEIETAMVQAMDAPGPVYIRLGSGNEPQLPFSRDPVLIGKAFALKEGRDVALIATGYMVHKAWDAAELLEEKGLSVGVYDHPSLKPLDNESIVASAETAQLVVTLEEHNIFGGLGSAVAEVISEAGFGVRMVRIGFKDLYPGVGEREDLLRLYEMDAASIAQRIEKTILTEE